MKKSILFILLLIFSIVLFNSAIQAATKNLEATCPEKVLEHGSFTAIYKGNECGDMCYSNFKFKNSEVSTC